MENESLKDGLVERRKFVRFSSSAEEFVFDAEKTAQRSGTEAPNTVLRDENLFRIPTTIKKKDSANTLSERVPLSEIHHRITELTISPGTKATEDKFNAKLQKLRKMQQKREILRSNKKVLPHSPKIDVVETQKSFMEWNSRETGNMMSTQLDYPAAEPKFSDISCIRASDASFSLKPSGVRDRVNIVCSTPLRQSSSSMLDIPACISKSSTSDISTPVQIFQPATAISSTIKEMVLTSDEEYLMSKEDRTQRQMKAMSVWCNMILRSQYEHEEFDIGSTKQEANKVLKDLLLRSRSSEATCGLDKKPFNYADFLRKQKRDSIRERATRLLKSSAMPQHIRSAVENRVFFIRADCNVYSDLTLQTTLLRLFLSFHPAWLHLGLETVFQTEIKVGDDETFAQVISRFILQRLFSDSKIMKKKKYAYGDGKLVVTDAGREALNSHFLLYTTLFCYFVETAKAASIINHNPRMFSKSSTFKCMEDVFSELSREVLSGSGASLYKAFSKMGFKPTYKQSFLDDYTYSVKTFGDLTDGIILGKIIELVTECAPGSLINRLRNPCGDRLRKIGNVRMCLQVASEQGVDVHAVKPELLVSGNSEAILEVLWKLVGIYVCAHEEHSLRREPLTFSKFHDGSELAPLPGNATSEEFVLHLCRQIGHHLGVKVETVGDLRDGLILAGAWRMYNVNAPDIRLYAGDSLLMKVANAAVSDLDVPWGLHHSIGLFAHIYLSRLLSMREVYDAAICIQRAYRSYKLNKAIKSWKSQHPTLNSSPVDLHKETPMTTFIVAPRVGGISVDDASEAFACTTHHVPEKIKNANEVISTSVIIEFQAVLRGFLVRRHLRALFDDIRSSGVQKGLALALQSHWRACHTKNYCVLRNEHPTILHAVDVIKRAFRYYCFRKKMRLERQKKWTEMEKAAVTIQSYYRMKKACKEVYHLKQIRVRRSAAIKIQSWMRTLFAMKELRQVKENQVKCDLANVHAAIQIQRAYRHYCWRKRMREQRHKAKLVKTITIFQAYIRGTLARRYASQLSQQRKLFIQKVIRIQRCFRGFLARRELKQALVERNGVLPEVDAVFEDTQRCTSSTSEEDERYDIKRVREIHYNVRENERLQKVYTKILKACELKLSEDSENERSTIEKQESHCCFVPSIADQTTAAVKIQAWFRGCRERARLHVHLQKRSSFMAAYRGNIAAEQPSNVVDNVALNSRPVSAKIHDAVDMLFDSKMYLSKVGAFILNRLSALSPHICAYLVLDAQGLVAILDILEQKTTGRGPATAEILVILQEVFLRIVECQHPVVVAEVNAQLADCAKVALHIFHAFYTHPVIVSGFGRAILALYRRPGAKKYFEKAPFYLDYATRRFNRLAETDPRKAILMRMKNEMLSS